MPYNQKIRVLRIINRFNLGGPTFNAVYLSKYLDDRFETLLVGGAKDESEASSEFIAENLGLQPTIIPEMKRSISVKDDYKAYKHIAKIIREFKPHIVHTHASKAGTLGRLAARNNNVPVITHTFHGHVFHSYFGTLQTTFYKGIERWLARASDRIIAISDQQKFEIGTEHDICPPDKISVVPLGFDLSRFETDMESKRAQFRSQYDLRPEHIAIGIIGRLVPVKNHSMFLKAAKQLLEMTDQPVRLFIIGDGESRDQLLREAAELGIGHTWMKPPDTEKPLCFTSWIKEVDVVMAGLDVVALTSLNEGTPVSLIEAQSACRPVVSTKVGGIQDIVIEGGSALLTDVNDHDAFSRHLHTLVHAPQRRQEMGKAGRAHVIEKYSYKRLVGDIENLYTSLLQEKKVSI